MAHRLVFRLGDEPLALPADIVREVVPFGRTTRVPHAPPALVGLGHVRGRVMPMVSMAALLDRPEGEARRVIVVDRGEPVGLVVEDAPRLIEDGKDASRLVDIMALLGQRFPARAGPAVARGVVRSTSGIGEVRRDDAMALFVFVVCGQSFALLLEQVEELIALPDRIALLPGGDGAALGSIAHRDALLPLLSLRGLLRLDGPPPARPRIVIVRVRGRRVGLAVDAVDAIVRVTEDAIDPVPLVLTRGAAETRIQAIVRREDGGLISLLATDHLFNDAVMARLQDEKSGGPIAGEGLVEAIEHVLVFRLGAEEFALPVTSVREVVAMPERLTRLPRAPAFVEGVMNLRGRAIPVIDQGRRFDAVSDGTGRRRVIVAMVGDLEAGFAVDAVSEVLRVPASQLRPAPDMGEGTRIFDRVATMAEGARMVLVIEPRELLDRAERDLLAAMGGADMPASL